MYKVEDRILRKVTKILDSIDGDYITYNMTSGIKGYRDFSNLRVKASKLSKLIKDNYTEIK